MGFSPVALQKSGRLTRQQAFIQKQPPSSGQVSKLVNMFEKQSTPNTASPDIVHNKALSSSVCSKLSSLNLSEKRGGMDPMNFNNKENKTSKSCKSDGKRLSISCQDLPTYVRSNAPEKHANSMSKSTSTTTLPSGIWHKPPAARPLRLNVEAEQKTSRRVSMPRKKLVFSGNDTRDAEKKNGSLEKITDISRSSLSLSITQEPSTNSWSFERMPHVYEEINEAHFQNRLGDGSHTENSMFGDGHIYEDVNIRRTSTPLMGTESFGIRPNPGIKTGVCTPYRTPQMTIKEKYLENSPIHKEPNFPGKENKQNTSALESNKHSSKSSKFAKLKSKYNSSTTRFRGTPVKLKLSDPVTPVSSKSCSVLSSSVNRQLTPLKVHSFNMSEAIPAFELDDSVKKSAGNLKPLMASKRSGGGTPVKLVKSVISKFVKNKSKGSLNSIVPSTEDVYEQF